MKKNTVIDKRTDKRIKEWLKAPLDKDTRDQIKELIDNHPNEASECFGSDLAFGTGGMRAVMGVGTNRLNIYTIRKATQGLANYIHKKGKKPTPAVVISYDCRHHSKTFAIEAARVLAANSIQVHIYQDLRPTPMASWGTRYFNCIAGIMITASHNPPQYNGYKVYWEDGAQVVAPHDQGIVDEVKKIEHFDQIKTAEKDDPLIQWIGKEADEAYLAEIQKLALLPHEDQEKGAWLNVLYSPLFGAGRHIVSEALRRAGFTSLKFVKGQEGPDGNFGGMDYPNPEFAEARSGGIAQMQKEKADLTLFTDPDSDRIAVSIMHEENPYSFTGNEIGTLLTYFIVETLKQQKKLPEDGAGITTIVSTPIFRHILEKANLQCLEVLTGFKYIGEKIHLWETTHPHFSYVFGFEESLGYLYGTHARDKDATIASLLICELALSLKKQGKTLLDQLYEIYSLYGVYREGQVSIECTTGQEKMLAMMQNLRKNPPESICQHKVTNVEDYAMGKGYARQNKETYSLDLPKANVLVFILDDHSKLIVRPSGTEPKIKLYALIKKLYVSCVTRQEIRTVDEEVQKLLTEAKKTLF